MAERKKENIALKELFLYTEEIKKESVGTDRILPDTVSSIEKILNSIHIDIEGIQKQIINTTKVNGLLSVFRIFGITVIKDKPRDTIYYKKRKDYGDLEQFIQIPGEEIKEEFQNISTRIKQYIEFQENRIRKLKEEDEEKAGMIQELRRKSEEKEKQISRQNDDLINVVQKLCGIESIRNDNELIEQIRQDYDIRVIFELPEKNVEHYFKTLNVTKVGNRLWAVDKESSYYMARPCLVREEQVLKQGLIYRLVEDTKE